MPEPMIKGAAIREFVAWYEARYGKEPLHQMAARVPADLAHHIDPEASTMTFLASTWYPARLVHAMLEAICETTSEAELELAIKEATRDIVQRGGSTVYRFFFHKLVTPELYAAAVPRLWRQLHSTGDRRITIVRPGLAESVVSRWPGHHRMLCTITIETMCALFGNMGKKDVRWHRAACISRGDRECLTRVTWR